MFGLMRQKRCSVPVEQRDERRLHYCGTCKTLGSFYGQKSRFLLDHDAVFLAELLSALSAKQEFGRAVRSYNCLARPQAAAEMPLPLQFAAATNVVLAQFKIGDRVADTNSLAARGLHKIFDKSFRQAQKQLQNWRVPVGELNVLPALQAERERFLPENLSARELLAYFAAPTARATGLFFAEGARLVGKEDLQEQMRALGAAFGEMIYLLDAFADYEKDFRLGDFNALRAAFELKEAKLANVVRREIENLLRQKELAVAEILRALPLANEKTTLFIARLHENLSRYLRRSLPVAAKTCASPKRRKSVGERLRCAVARSRELSANSTWWQLPFAFATVLIVTFLVPNQAREARDWRECSELGFNLMFLGAAFGAVIALPKTILLENPEELLTKEGRQRKLQKAVSGENNSWCGGCDCCNCGNCCGEGFVDACCCGCESCSCCGDGCCCDCSCN